MKIVLRRSRDELRLRIILAHLFAYFISWKTFKLKKNRIGLLERQNKSSKEIIQKFVYSLPFALRLDFNIFLQIQN